MHHGFRDNQNARDVDLKQYEEKKTCRGCQGEDGKLQFTDNFLKRKKEGEKRWNTVE